MKKILSIVLAIVMGVTVMAAPVVASADTYAEGQCVLTTILGTDECDANGNKMAGGGYKCSCDDGEGGEIKRILGLVVRIMSVGIAILGAIGIAVSGIQYLTAGGNEEKTRKAKRRVFELVIGLAAYAIMYALLSFFLPDFNGL